MIETAFQQGLYDYLSTDSVTTQAGLAVTDETEVAVARTLGLEVQVVSDFRRQTTDGELTTSFPCVTIGEIDVTQYDTQRTNGFEIDFRVHCYSRSGSAKETKDRQGYLYRLLHNKSIVAENYRPVLIQRSSSRAMRDEDGTFHGVCDYRALTERA